MNMCTFSHENAYAVIVHLLGCSRCRSTFNNCLDDVGHCLANHKKFPCTRLLSYHSSTCRLSATNSNRREGWRDVCDNHHLIPHSPLVDTIIIYLRRLAFPSLFIYFFRARPKILALCGARSNNAVTQLQLENLHITSECYDIHYLHGNIIVEDDDDVDATLAGMVRGPFYSWIDTTSGFEAMNESIVNSVRLVIGATRAYGPFDGVYGFSHGTCESLEMMIIIFCMHPTIITYCRGAHCGTRRQHILRLHPEKCRPGFAEFDVRA